MYLSTSRHLRLDLAIYIYDSGSRCVRRGLTTVKSYLCITQVIQDINLSRGQANAQGFAVGEPKKDREGVTEWIMIKVSERLLEIWT